MDSYEDARRKLKADMNVNLNAEEDIGLLLIGDTGNGKSALGNTILGQSWFVSQGGFDAITKVHSMGITRINGRIVKVVDIPGLNDTDLTTKNDRLNLVINEITKALTYFPDGFHAIIPVIPYNKRMTDDTQKTIDTMVSLLEPNALEKRGIVAITHGDAFKLDFGNDEVDLKFQEYLEKLTSKYQWVNELCEKRCLLFDNKTDSQDVKKDQREALLTLIVDKLKSRGRYMPEICNIKIDKRATAIRDKEQLTKYVKAASTLGILIFKIQTAVIDDPQFNEISRIALGHDATALKNMMITDNVFGPRVLGSFSTEMKRLTSAATTDSDKLLEIAKIVIREIRKLQLQIDCKIETTPYWQILKKRVETFFEKMRSKCEIL